MSSDQDFIQRLNQHYGTPTQVGIDAFKKVTDGNLFKQMGMAVCAKEFPQIPAYAASAGAAAGVVVTLLVVFIWNTIVHRRRG